MNTLWMIGNTHFDPAWLWTWDEAMASIRATFRSALARMDEDLDFRYSFSTPAVFEWIEETDPELFKAIQQRVREGRWEITSEGWWLQPDCHLPTGESLVRQGLYGQRYLQEHFSLTADTVFNIDSFGHSAMMPQIMRKCRLYHYVFTRPAQDEYALNDNLFRWIAPDGSSVNAYRAGSAGENDFPSYPQGDIAELIRHRRAKLLADSHDHMIVFGVSDHGGAPTKKSIREIHQAIQENTDLQVRFGTVSDYFSAQEGRITASVHGEILCAYYGPLSDEPEVKRNNRKGEYSLLQAEKAAFMAERLVGKAYPQEALRKAWKDLLFNQFHDILGGTSTPEVFEDARNMSGRILQTAGEIRHFSIQSVCRKIRMLGDNDTSVWNLCIFNLNGTPYRGLLEAEVQWTWEYPWYQDGIELFDEEGNTYPAQIILERSAFPGFRSRFVFRADIPALGYRTYAVRKTGQAVDKTLPESSLESPFEVRMLQDDGDTWCFNTRNGYGDAYELPRLTRRKVLENGIHRETVKQEWSFRCSTFEEIFSLDRATGFIDYRYTVNWHEQHTVLKLVPRAQYDAEYIHCAIPYGSVSRPMNPADKPCNEWLVWGNDKGGMTFLLDGVFAYDTRCGTPRFTLLRSPISGDLRMAPLDEHAEYTYMGQGMHTGRIGCIPEVLTAEAAYGFAAHWIAPPTIVCEANHDGQHPSANTLVSETNGVHINAIKQAEDGDGYVVRIAEYNGVAQRINMRLETLGSCTLNFSPYEIKTLRFRQNGVVQETDMLEISVC
ncbi:MAG: glycoside hydrolase family 38 C-terminal domain-containing protein [Christensenellales bacterium]|jgi:alpha-mannosidase